MIPMNKRITIQTLVKSWLSKIEIAERIWCHRNTVTNIMKESPIKSSATRMNIVHSLDKFKEIIEYKINKWLSIKRIHEYLVEEKWYTKTYNTVQKYVKNHNLKPSLVYQVINTDPWEEWQVDFWYVWLTPNPEKEWKKRKTYVFVMTLWYSRKAFHKVVYDQKVSTFLECHIEAFEYFW